VRRIRGSRTSQSEIGISNPEKISQNSESASQRVSSIGTTLAVLTAFVAQEMPYMPKLLQLDASPLETSVSRELTREFVAAWKTANPDGTIVYRDLARLTPAPINQAWIHAAYTPADARTAEQKALLAFSDELIHELESADEIVIGVPMHNFSIPSSLKPWIDQIARAGRTFTYDANGARGLLQNKKATLLVASGGVYSAESPAAALNFVDPYLKAVLGFLGITDVRILSVGGVAQLMSGAIDRGTLLAPALEQIRTTAA
jgi:FMN-dependent NADH-azoreductase